MFTITPSPKVSQDLRNDYLDLLPEPQELFVENLVAEGSSWSIRRDGREIGYAVTDGRETLLELYLIQAELTGLAAAFDVLIETCGLRCILAKSFDPILLFAAFSRPCQLRTVGMLYRVIADARFEQNAAIMVRAAGRVDVGALLRLGGDFFTGPAEILDYIGGDGLMIYETADGAALGAGVMKRVVAGRRDVDIGMVVAPERRRRGLGAYIVAHLKTHCLERGLRPICGCAIDNLASQRTLERAGFASRHTLVEFQFQKL